MKKLVFILLITSVALGLMAIEFEWDGEFRARGALYNYTNGTPGGHIDNRLQIGVRSEITEDLTLRAKLEFGKTGSWGNTIWGDTGGYIGTQDVNIKTSEAYIDYQVNKIKTKFRIGQQYWADHRSLILDDTFSGITAWHELGEDMSVMLGYIKYHEGNTYNRYDDYQGFVFSFDTENPINSGVQGFFNWNRTRPVFNQDPVMLKDFILMPYASMKLDPVNLDGVLFFQRWEWYDVIGDKVEAENAIGAAFKADADIDALSLRADLILITDNNLVPLSEFYQNGLYIFGIGEHNENLGIWWRTSGDDNYLAAALGAKYALFDGIKAFANGGMVLKTGLEVNGGAEFTLVPEYLNLAIYGAYGIVDKDAFPGKKNAYALGSTLKMEF